MNKPLAAALLLALASPTGISGAAQGDKPKPADPRPRFEIIRVGETAILLDSQSGQTWQLQRPTGKKEPVWVPIRKAEGAGEAGMEVPVVEEMNVAGDIAYFGPRDVSKQEARKWERDFAPSSPQGIVFRSAQEAASKFRDERVLTRFAKQFDPRRQQLVLFHWVCWSSDKFRCEVRDGKVVFVHEAGPQVGRKCSEDSPNTYTRLFAVRQGVEWSIVHRGPPGPEGKPVREPGKPGAR
jgi:hypothetical protein